VSQHDAATGPETARRSTQAVDAEVAIDYWRSVRRKAYVDVAPTPYAPNFFGDINYASYGDFALSVKRASGEKVTRNRLLISHGTEDEEYLYALFQSRGTGVITQAGHSAEIRPGRVVIYDTAQPFSLDYQGPYEQVVVHLPAARAFADAGLRPSTDLLAVAIPVDGALSAVSAFFLNLASTQAADPVGAGILAPHAAGLASSLLAYAARIRGTDDLPLLLQRERALAYMRHHLSDPELDVDRIAVGCHVSRRTLYRLFEGTGQTVTMHLRTIRIAAAQRLLANQADLSVDSIARGVGFVSDAHFYRSFRAITGVTPGEYRQLAQQGAADLRARVDRLE
jgi:AraC-like DNA-binding protein